MRNSHELALAASYAVHHSLPLRVSPEEMSYLRWLFDEDPDATVQWDQVAADSGLVGPPLNSVPIIVDWPKVEIP